MTATRPPPDASPVSRTLHFLTARSSNAAASTFAAAASAVVFGSAISSRHTNRILVWFAAVAGALTLVMVFVLQHTQTRQQDALHHKLDEVLHALPDADDRLIKLESASDSEVVEVERRHTALRDDAHTS